MFGETRQQGGALAVAVKVQCVTRSRRAGLGERIESIGGVNEDGSPWELSQQRAIAGIEAGRYSFVIEEPAGHRVYVVIATSPGGDKYLKTTVDVEQPERLLRLPDCP